jgi:hypothetical protein
LIRNLTAQDQLDQKIVNCQQQDQLQLLLATNKNEFETRTPRITDGILQLQYHKNRLQNITGKNKYTVITPGKNKRKVTKNTVTIN